MKIPIHKGGEPIESMDDWFRLAPPEGGLSQWKDGRSAKETARRWLMGMPPEVSATMASHLHLRDFAASSAEPEVETELDEFFRTRHHDLVVEGTCGDISVLMCVEAKADEPFDRHVGRRIATASPTSKLPERIRRISLALFGHDRIAEIADLRYQLLQATAGSLIEARDRGADRCVFLVHAFRTALTNDELMAANDADLDRFVSRLTFGSVETVPPDTAVGPITMGLTQEPRFPPLYIARAKADLLMKA